MRDAARGCPPRASPLADQTLRLGGLGGRLVTADPVCRRVVLDIRGYALRIGMGVGWCFDGVRPHARHKSAHGRERLGPGAEPAKHHDSSVRAAFRPVNPVPTRGPAVLHESGHVSLDLAHANSAGWRAAQEADGVFISDYARDFPDREDIAESIPPYFAVRYWPERLTETVRSAILAAIPNRLAYFDEQGFDMSPYRARGSTTRVLGLRPFQPRRIWRPFEGSPMR